ncbi:MAG: hypothetical protein PHC62_00155 [Candidatus Izemoplasmatales bacterium]|nr:hypothetical protein [Candidatus Izemoplasmatales bacterium]
MKNKNTLIAVIIIVGIVVMSFIISPKQALKSILPFGTVDVYEMLFKAKDVKNETPEEAIYPVIPEIAYPYNMYMNDEFTLLNKSYFFKDIKSRETAAISEGRELSKLEFPYGEYADKESSLLKDK